MTKKEREELATLRAELARVDELYAAAEVKRNALQMQLTSWHEISRGLENQAAVWQRMYLDLLEQLRRVGAGNIDMAGERSRVELALRSEDATRTGIESLIMAVSLASSRQAEVIGQLLPQLAPTLAQLERLPPKPRTQLIAGAQAERTAIVVSQNGGKRAGRKVGGSNGAR